MKDSRKMNDYIYIPRYTAKLLLQDQAHWEDVESLVSLLTVAAIKEPVEELNGFSRYIVKTSELKERFRASAKLGLFSFSLKNKPIPYIHDLVISKPPYKTIDYKVHDLCNPRYYALRYNINSVFNVFPVGMWRMPRHVLIRWRYSAKLPIHKGLFSKPIKMEDWFKISLTAIDDGKEIKTIQEAILTFKDITKHFYSIMCLFYESSITYSFVCYVYFFAHDSLIGMIKKNVVNKDFFRFLKKLKICLEAINFLDMPLFNKAIKLEGMIREILPNSFYTISPHSIFCRENFRYGR